MKKNGKFFSNGVINCKMYALSYGVDHRLLQKFFASSNFRGRVSNPSLEVSLNQMKYQACKNKKIFEKLFPLQIYAGFFILFLSTELLIVGTFSENNFVLDQVTLYKLSRIQMNYFFSPFGKTVKRKKV